MSFYGEKRYAVCKLVNQDEWRPVGEFGSLVEAEAALSAAAVRYSVLSLWDREVGRLR